MCQREQELIEHYTGLERLEELILNNINTQAGEGAELN